MMFNEYIVELLYTEGQLLFPSCLNKANRRKLYQTSFHFFSLFYEIFFHIRIKIQTIETTEIALQNVFLFNK